MIRIERIYRDTSNYEEKKGLPLAKAFAKSLEWLYDKSYFSEEEDDFLWHAKYQMSGVIPLYDLMSIEALVISRAWSDFRISGVNTLISQLEAGASPLSTHELKYDGDHLIIGGFQWHLMEVILWAAYIYCLFRSELEKDNIKAKRASQLLHELFVQKAGDPKSNIEGHFLMKHLNQTMVTFAKNLPTKHRPSENKKSPDSKDDSTAELQSRIAELEAELKKTNEENAKLNEENRSQNTENAELQARIKELLAQLKKITEENVKLQECKIQPQAIVQQQAGTDEKDAAIIEQLKPIFWGDEEQIESFLEKIRGKKNTAVIDVIAKAVKDRIISEQSCHRDLWKILHDAELYKATESNYNLALNKKL